MNRLSPRFVGYSTSLILGLMMLIGACGPQDMNDPDYLMQLKSSGVADALESGQAPQGAQDENQQAQAPQGQPANSQDAQPVGQGVVAGAPAVAPATGVAVPVAVPAVPPVVPIGPPTLIQHPTLVENLPTRVVPLVETRLFGGEVHHRRVIQRVMRTHFDTTIFNNTNIHHRYFTLIENLPVITRRACPVFTTTMTQEVMPPVEITRPVIDTIIPCVGPVCAPPPPPPPCVGCMPLYRRGILPF